MKSPDRNNDLRSTELGTLPNPDPTNHSRKLPRNISDAAKRDRNQPKNHTMPLKRTPIIPKSSLCQEVQLRKNTY